ncbi:MAG: hypothetical protein OXF93_23345 [Acidobacteria bacterium]|nr:hypothetical protein [Acidobacteriota bacterium]
MILALMFFAWRALVFPVPTVGGAWYCLTIPKYSTNSDFYGQFLGWRVVLAQSDRGIGGSSEKIWEGKGETDKGRNRVLTGDEIDRGEIEGGSLQYNYFSTSRLSLHAVIDPKHSARKTTWYLDLDVGDQDWSIFRRPDPQTLHGTYYWTSADQRGDALCRRKRVNWDAKKDLESFQCELTRRNVALPGERDTRRIQDFVREEVTRQINASMVDVDGCAPGGNRVERGGSSSP